MKEGDEIAELIEMVLDLPLMGCFFGGVIVMGGCGLEFMREAAEPLK